METVTDEIALGDIALTVERPEDPEALVDEEAFAENEFLPYWAERWTSGIALAEHVSHLDLRDRRVLEIGCGLGLPALVAARLGAEVVATDWSADAVALLARNAARNGIRLVARAADWRDADALASLGPFDLVLAADVLYEERNATPILALLELLGAPATIADPGRRHAAAFLDDARRDGWTIDTEDDPRIPSGGIHQLRRPTRS